MTDESQQASKEASAEGADEQRPGLLADLDQLMRLGIRQIRKLVVFVVGITVVLIGVLMVLTPGPAVIVIPIGLGILALEFAWAKLLLKRFREGAYRLGSDISNKFRKD